MTGACGPNNLGGSATFGCKCFLLKAGKLDKFESRSSNGIYHTLNLETNRIMETYEITFDETMPCTTSIFECAGEQEIGESIFVEEEQEDAD